MARERKLDSNVEDRTLHIESANKFVCKYQWQPIENLDDPWTHFLDFLLIIQVDRKGDVETLVRECGVFLGGPEARTPSADLHLALDKTYTAFAELVTFDKPIETGGLFAPLKDVLCIVAGSDEDIVLDGVPTLDVRELFFALDMLLQLMSGVVDTRLLRRSPNTLGRPLLVTTDVEVAVGICW